MKYLFIFFINFITLTLTGQPWSFNSTSFTGIESPTNSATAGYTIAMGSFTTASGTYSTAMGIGTTASGFASVSVGNGTNAFGDHSIAIGQNTNASGKNSIAVGDFATTNGENSASIGLATIASGYNTVAIGLFNDDNSPTSTIYSSTNNALIIGNGTDGSSRSNAFAVLFNGQTTIAGSVTAPSFIGDGLQLTSVGRLENITEAGKPGWRFVGRNPLNYGNIGLSAVDLSTSINSSNVYGATGDYSIAMGVNVTSSGYSSVAMGLNTTASGTRSMSMGSSTIASGPSSTAMGGNTAALGDRSTAMGGATTASGYASTAMGEGTTASEYASIAIGNGTTASGYASIAMGRNTTASGENSTTMGSNTIASENSSTAMGFHTEASGDRSTAMGSSTTASGIKSTAMGDFTTASGLVSTTTGYYSTASGTYSTAMGYFTTASGYGTLAIGTYNTIDNNANSTQFSLNNRAFVVGNGFSTRSDAMTVLFDGTTTIAGDLTVNSDARLKTNFLSLGNTLPMLKMLDGKTYNLKSNESQEKIGLLAQDVQKVFPQLVRKAGDDQGTLSLNYQGLIPVLINAVNEQQEMIETYEVRLDRQQKQIDKLTALVESLVYEK